MAFNRSMESPRAQNEVYLEQEMSMQILASITALLVKITLYLPFSAWNFVSNQRVRLTQIAASSLVPLGTANEVPLQVEVLMPPSGSIIAQDQVVYPFIPLVSNRVMVNFGLHNHFIPQISSLIQIASTCVESLEVQNEVCMSPIPSIITDQYQVLWSLPCVRNRLLLVTTFWLKFCSRSPLPVVLRLL